MRFVNNIKSEYIKTKRSSAAWLALGGGFFIPLILTIGQFYTGETINDNSGPQVWLKLFRDGWQNMGPFLLPMGVILITTLITQLEFKNNTWKQVHAAPISYPEVFLTKLFVVGVMIIQCFLYFTIGLFIAAILPAMVLNGHLPEESIPFGDIFKLELKFFIFVLPIVAFQYLLALKFKNFLVPVGIGLLGIIGTLIGLSWEYLYVSPFAFVLHHSLPIAPDYPMLTYSCISTLVLIVAAFGLYWGKKEKG